MLEISIFYVTLDFQKVRAIAIQDKLEIPIFLYCQFGGFYKISLAFFFRKPAGANAYKSILVEAKTYLLLRPGQWIRYRRRTWPATGRRLGREENPCGHRLRNDRLRRASGRCRGEFRHLVMLLPR